MSSDKKECIKSFLGSILSTVRVPALSIGAYILFKGLTGPYGEFAAEAGSSYLNETTSATNCAYVCSTLEEAEEFRDSMNHEMVWQGGAFVIAGGLACGAGFVINACKSIIPNKISRNSIKEAAINACKSIIPSRVSRNNIEGTNNEGFDLEDMARYKATNKERNDKKSTGYTRIEGFDLEGKEDKNAEGESSRLSLRSIVKPSYNSIS